MSNISGIRRALLLKVISKPQPSREDVDSVVELTAGKVVDMLEAQSMTLYLVEGRQIAFRHVYYSPSLWMTTRRASASSRTSAASCSTSSCRWAPGSWAR
jgi:type IV pilus assembly protein PilB